MKKPPLQDVIVMRDIHRTGEVRDVRPRLQVDSEPRHTTIPARRSPVFVEREPQVERHEYRDNSFYEEGEGKSRTWLWAALIVGVTLVGSAFALSLAFSGATVTVYPRQETLVAETSFTVSTQGAQADLSAPMVTLERTAVREVVAQSEVQVEERASGKITVYNAYSKSPQRLIKNTRFEAEDGKVYRIRESIEVPGRKDDETPGSLDVTVYAEEPGEAYNHAPGAFSVPGFVDYPQEGKIYARANTEITGGFVGTKRTVLEKDRIASYEALETQLRDELRAALAEEGALPEGAWIDPDTVFFEFSPLPDEIAEGENVRLSLSGKVHAVAFDAQAFDRLVAERTIVGFVDAPIQITNRNDLSVVVQAQEEGTTTARLAWELGTYTVLVSGKTSFLWQVDPVALTNSLLGIEKSLVVDGLSEDMRAEYPGVDRIHVVSRPFWKRVLPSQPDDITLTVQSLDD
ncbi:MAG: hypothetical protein KBD21_02370 [Candidatus Pacebacteria bacterium]|nr:hypothetical protein [Candidatus Paceibacterota bacterium]